MAEIVDRSVHTIHKIECKKLGLSKEVASRMARGTGISLQWLLEDDTSVEPTGADGKEYTRETFDRTQAREKIPDDQPHEFLRNTIAAGFVGRMIAILEGSSDYRMCAYKMHKALESVRQEFGQDQKLYPVANRGDTNYGLHENAIPLLEKLLETAKQIDFTLRNYDALVAGIPANELKKELKEREAGQPTLQQSKRPSKKRRR
jgi:hypothetical protein